MTNDDGYEQFKHDADVLAQKGCAGAAIFLLVGLAVACTYGVANWLHLSVGAIIALGVVGFLLGCALICVLAAVLDRIIPDSWDPTYPYRKHD